MPDKPRTRIESTPPPWKARKAGKLTFSADDGKTFKTAEYPAHVIRVYRDEQGRRCTQFLADCNGANAPNEANAALMAAAPELLASLEAILAFDENGRYNSVRVADRMRAEKAIKQAGGGE